MKLIVIAKAARLRISTSFQHVSLNDQKSGNRGRESWTD